MSTHPTHLVDQESNRIAVLHVEPAGGLFRGTICLAKAPPRVKRLFEEFEENVEGQMFPLADEIEEQIGAMRLRVVFANGEEAQVEDLQVYPSTNRVSFKVRQPTSAS